MIVSSILQIKDQFLANTETLAFLLLPILLGGSATKGKADEERFKPTKIESQGAFTVRLQVN